MIRWSYVVPRAVVILLVIAAAIWGLSPLARRLLIGLGQQITGARVEIGDLQARWWNLELVAEDVQLANPGSLDRNWFQFQEGAIRLDVAALSRRRVVIDYARLQGVEWNGSRSESGVLADSERRARRWRRRLAARSERWAESARDWLEQFGRWAGDAALEQFETVRLASQLEDKWKHRAEQWESRLVSFQQRAGRLQRLAESVRREPARHVAEIQEVISGALTLRDELLQTRIDYERLLTELETDLRRMDRAREADLQRLQKSIQLARLDSRELNELLLGRELAERVQVLLDWCDVVRETIGTADDMEDPQRLRGEDIVWTEESGVPSFVARVVDLDGLAAVRTQRIPFQARLQNLTSRPRSSGPVLAQIRLLTSDPTSIRLRSDLSGSEPVHEFTFGRRTTLPPAVWGDSGSLTLAVESGRLHSWAQIRLEGKQLDGVLLLRQEELELQPALSSDWARTCGAATSERVTRRLEKLVEQLRSVEARVTISGTLAEPRWSFQTDVGRRLTEGLEAALAAEVEFWQREATIQIARQATLGRQQVVQLVEDRLDTLYAELQPWSEQFEQWSRWQNDPRHWTQLLPARTARRLGL